jgi:hypothetical protein
MTQVPLDPQIFHITHVNNLPGIIGAGGLWCDAQRIKKNLVTTNIAHQHIKQRRLAAPVKAGAGGTLGEYVPFNFCPRSVMLLPIASGRGEYSGGQESVVHLVSSVAVAVALGRPWAFTDRHAELAHSLHYDDLQSLDEVPWQVMDKKYWSEVKEERQAEFLVKDSFPWSAISEVAAMTANTADRVSQILLGAPHTPGVTIRPEWYY